MNETVLTTAKEADANGYTNPRRVGTKEIQDDTQLNNRLADVATKLTRYESTVQQPLSEKDRGLIASALEDDKFKIGALGAELPVDWMNQLAKASYFNQMSPDAQKKVIAYFNSRESMVGYQRVLSGSGRSSDKAMELNLQALPSPLTDPGFARESIGQFKENLHVAGRGLPRMPGIPKAEDVLRGNQRTNFPIPQPFGGNR
jgi:hypothetical protein